MFLRADFDPVERKKSIRRLTEKYCSDFKNNKLEEYRASLDSQKKDYLKEKLDTLKWIRNEEIKCCVEPTVTDEDLRAAEKQLINHLEQLKLKPVRVDVSRNILTDM